MVLAASSERPWAEASSHSSGTISPSRWSVSVEAVASMAPPASDASMNSSDVLSFSQAPGSQPFTETRVSPYAWK